MLFRYHTPFKNSFYTSIDDDIKNYHKNKIGTALRKKCVDNLIPCIQKLILDQIQASLQQHFKNTTEFLHSEHVHSLSIPTFQNPTTKTICENMKQSASNILFNREALSTKAERLLYSSIMEIFRFQSTKESHFEKVPEYFQLPQEKNTVFLGKLIESSCENAVSQTIDFVSFYPQFQVFFCNITLTERFQMNLLLSLEKQLASETFESLTTQNSSSPLELSAKQLANLPESLKSPLNETQLDTLPQVFEELKKEIESRQGKEFKKFSKTGHFIPDPLDIFIRDHIRPILNHIMSPKTHPKYRPVRKWVTNNQRFVNYVSIVMLMKRYSIEQQEALNRFWNLSDSFPIYPFKWWEVYEFQKMFQLENCRDPSPPSGLSPEDQKLYDDLRNEINECFIDLNLRIVNDARLEFDIKEGNESLKKPDGSELVLTKCIRKNESIRPPSELDIREFIYDIRKVTFVYDESDDTSNIDNKSFLHPNEKAICEFVLNINPKDNPPSNKKPKTSKQSKKK